LLASQSAISKIVTGVPSSDSPRQLRYVLHANQRKVAVASNDGDSGDLIELFEFPFQTARLATERLNRTSGAIRSKQRVQALQFDAGVVG